MSFLAKVKFTAGTQSGVGDRTFSYAGIELFPNTQVAHSEQLAVYRNSILQTLTTHYTVDTAASTIVFNSGVIESGNTITIQRNTKQDDRYTDWTDNTILDAADLNLDSDQLFFLIQENIDGLDDALLKHPSGLYWQGEGLYTGNFAPAIGNAGLTTLGQVRDLIAGLDTATVDNATQWLFSGDGSTTDFSLTSAASGTNSAAQLQVYVDGVKQVAGTSYTLNTSTDPIQIEFVVAPASGTNNIEVIEFSGTVAVNTDSNTISGTAIINDSMPVNRLDFDAGANGRTIVVDSAGTPSVANLTTSDLSGFNADVTNFRLDQFVAPSADLNLNNNQINNLTSGSASGDAVNKGQMDAAISAAVASISAASIDFDKGTGSLSSGSATINAGFTPYFSLLTISTVDPSSNTLNASNSNTYYLRSTAGTIQIGTGTLNYARTGTGFTLTHAGSGTVYYDYLTMRFS